MSTTKRTETIEDRMRRELSESPTWTEEQWQEGKRNFDRWRATLPDYLIFTESELCFAAIAICDYFGVDRDEDRECCDVQETLRAHGRMVQ